MAANTITFDSEYMRNYAKTVEQAKRLVEEANACLKRANRHGGWRCAERQTVNNSLDGLSSRLIKISNGLGETSSSLTKGAGQFADLESRSQREEASVYTQLKKNWLFEAIKWVAGIIGGAVGGMPSAIIGDGEMGRLLPITPIPGYDGPPVSVGKKPENWPGDGSVGVTQPSGLNIGNPDINSRFYYSKAPALDRTLDEDIMEDGLSPFPDRKYYGDRRINCTVYAYGRAMEKTGVELTGITGNAGGWLKEAEAHNIPHGNDIKTNSIAVFGKGGSNNEGHVVFIENVTEGDPKLISVSEGNGGNRSEDGEILNMPYNGFIEKYGTPSGYIYTDSKG